MTNARSAQAESYKHGPDGRFTKGTRGGPGGSRLAAKVSALRIALLDAVSQEDIKGIASALVEKAKGGDVPAAREVLERCLGKPEATDLAIQLERIEERLQEAKEKKKW